MSLKRANTGAPQTHKGFLWSKIIDAMAGGASAANGDILYRTGGLWSRLPVGTNGYILKIVSGAPTWTVVGGGGGVGYSTGAYQVANHDIGIGTGTTYQDTNLLVPLDPGTYVFQVEVFCVSNSAPDMKQRLHFTGTATEVKYRAAFIIDGNANYFNSFEEALDIDAVYTSNSNNQTYYWGTIKITAAGNFSYQFAQNTAVAATIRVTASSNMIVHRIA